MGWKNDDRKLAVHYLVAVLPVGRSTDELLRSNRHRKGRR